MKKIFLGMFVLGFYLNCLGQTKSKTYEYLNEKLEMYKLDDIQANYIFMFQEMKLKIKKL